MLACKVKGDIILYGKGMLEEYAPEPALYWNPTTRTRVVPLTFSRAGTTSAIRTVLVLGAHVDRSWDFRPEAAWGSDQDHGPHRMKQCRTGDTLRFT